MIAEVESTDTGAATPFNKALYAYGRWGKFELTHAGALLGGIELAGVDPTGLGVDDRQLMSLVLRGLYQGLPQSLVFSQYYWHYEGVTLDLALAGSERSQALTQRRMDYLHKRGLNGSRLYWTLECPAEENINKLWSLTTVKHLFQAPVEKESRQLLLAKLSNRQAWLAEEQELNRQTDVLTQALNGLAARTEILAPNNELMPIEKIWALNRAMTNLEPGLLESAQRENVPLEDWDTKLANGRVKPVEINGMSCLKFAGAKPKYARIVSITAFGNKSVNHGIWISSKISPVLQSGNYLICNRFSPLSKIKKGLMLRSKENELFRQNIKLTTLLSGENPNNHIEKRMESSAAMKKILEEIEDAELSEDRWGHYNSHVVLWSDDPVKLKVQSAAMDTALTESDMHVVWESAGLMQLFPTLLPGYAKKSLRSMVFNTSQAGAASLIYRSSEGTKKNTVTIEPTYVFESKDKVPFSFSEFIHEKGLVIGTGPTRSGKTFAKNCIASHFMRFGGIYRDIGVDAGSEPMATYFEEEAGIFRITDPNTSKGFAAFAAADPADGDQDGLFFAHMLGMLRVMLGLNDAEDLKRIESSEQRVLDEAIRAVMRMPERKLRTLSQLHTHLPPELKRKFDRWVGTGPYANMFDNVMDDLGTEGKKIGIYNLSGLKDIPELAALAQREIFYRTTKLFENPDIVDVVKQVTIDECQYFLQVPGAAKFLEAKVRTWNKFNAGISLWTQSPDHYQNIPDWKMLRSSATAFVFGAEPKMDKKLAESYMEVYGCTKGIVEGIESLQPRKELFIWQPESDVAKVICLNADKEQTVISTSRPKEAAVIKQLLAKYPNDPLRAIDEAVKELKLEDAV